jgi:hypothetical protein
MPSLTARIPDPAPRMNPADWAVLVLVSAFGMVLGLAGIRHQGYIGQDFTMHRDLVLSFPGGYTYARTNPPGLYFLGSAILGIVGRGHYLAAIAAVFLVLNAAALWVFYGLLRPGFQSRPLWYAACALITFVPFRQIHSIVLAADALTLPLFAAAAWLTLRLFTDPRRAWTWAGLSAVLVAGMFCKYTMIGLLPPVALLAGVALMRGLRGREIFRWAAAGVLALALPAAAFLLQVQRTVALSGPLAENHWLPKGAPAVMRWRDILLLRRSDAPILAAPDFVHGELYAFRKYSYPALVHDASFTDMMNLFQPPFDPRWRAIENNIQNQFPRLRTPGSQALQIIAVRWSLVFSVLAVAGTLMCIMMAALALLRGDSSLADPVVVLTTLAVGYYAPVFLNLHRLADPYNQGFWLPRLILPALVTFLALGFVGVDRALDAQAGAGTARVLERGLAWYTGAACLIYFAFLS